MELIKEVILEQGVNVKNLHDGTIYPTQNIIKVVFKNGDCNILDLFSKADITNIDYFEVLENDNTKKKILFRSTDDER